jgi:UPF0755 protein
MRQRRKAAIVLFALLKVFVLFLVILVLVSVGRKAYSFGYRVFAEETVSDPPGKKVAVTIEDGLSASELASLLKEKRLILDENVFFVQYQLSQYKGKVKGGSYVLNTSMTSEEILKEISSEEDGETETDAQENTN